MSRGVHGREYTKPDDVDLSAGPIIQSMQLSIAEPKKEVSKVDTSIRFEQLLNGSGDGDGDGDGIHDDGDGINNNSSGSHNDSSHNDTTHNNTPSHSRSSPSQRDRSRSRHHAHTHHDHSPSHSHSRPDRSRSRNDHSHSHRHSRHHRSPSPDDTYRYGVEDAHNETWLREGLEVKVMNQKLGDGALYKKKGVVTGLIDPFTAKVRIPECNLSIKIDQVEVREEGEE